MRKLRERAKTIGFVPTMGALHDGHLALVRRARRENDIVAVSIFVNPAQFGPKEDFKRYPRTIGRDEKLLKNLKVDYLFHPTPKAMYPDSYALKISMGSPWVKDRLRKKFFPLLENLCGKYRPGHFEGVMAIVAKLLVLAQCHRTYFGQKDYQQAILIRRMIEDLHFDVIMKVLPTVRESDGLAMSSRNRYLSGDERRRAVALSRTLFWLRGQVRSGTRNILWLKREAARRLKPAVDKIQYFDIVDPQSLASLRRWQTEMVVLTACFVGKTRLIDNVTIKVKNQKS
ncbi:MAG: pantoate--beta-alanine ligase [Candidatus Omnitrophica bacterium]|nr:pantoate--beta-alanine ligase [Candidatus Omnitrophota bacterium]